MKKTWFQDFPYKAGLGAFAGLFLLSGCGFKAPPVAPETVVPMAIEDLRYSLDGDQVSFSWSYPTRTIAGNNIEELDIFELYQAEMPIDEVCENCPIPFGEPIDIEAGVVLDGEERRKGSYELSGLKSGYKYFYTMRSKTSWWASSDDSNIVSFLYYTPPEAVETLVVQPADGEIELSWQPASLLSDGSTPPAGFVYQVQRADAEGDFTNLGEVQGETRYIDDRVAFGKTYRYRVQTYMEYGDDLVQGQTSEVVTAGSVDLMAPPTPKALRVVELGDGFKLFWDRVDVPDLGGYRIYRMKRGGSAMELIAEVGAGVATYTDKAAGDYVYSVSAFDLAPTPNESGRSLQVGPR